jgi:hypothetical protein
VKFRLRTSKPFTVPGIVKHTTLLCSRNLALNYESEMFYSIDFEIPIVRNIAVVLINLASIVAEVTKCRKELYLMLKKPLFHR